MSGRRRWTFPRFTGEPRVVAISPMQANVLDSLIQGKTNRQIGRDWYIAEDTVKTHMRRMLAATRAHDRTHLLALLATGELIIDVAPGQGRPQQPDLGDGATLSPGPTYAPAL